MSSSTDTRVSESDKRENSINMDEHSHMCRERDQVYN